MKRRDFLTKAGAGAALAATAVPAIGQASQVRWRMSTMWPKSLDAMHGSAELFARRVGELTEGRFTIQATAAGEIVPPPQVFDAVQNKQWPAFVTAIDKIAVCYEELGIFP